MTAFTIGRPDSDHLTVSVLNRSHDARDYWDGNWLDAEIQITTASFHAHYSASLRVEEMDGFRQELSELYSFTSQTAAFTTMERQLSIHILGSKTGRYTAKCEAVAPTGIGNRLLFQILFDQTEIPQMLKELDAILKEYPVIGNPN